MLGDKKANIKFTGDFTPLPEGVYTVQVADVNLKTQYNTFKAVDEDRLNYQFVVLDDVQVDGETTRGRFLWHAMSQSLNEKSWLFKFVKAVYGRDLTKEELEAFANDPESVIGKQVNAVVIQKPSSDKMTIYNNIVSYSKAPKELEPMVLDLIQKKGDVEKSTQPAMPSEPMKNPFEDDPFAVEEKPEDKK